MDPVIELDDVTIRRGAATLLNAMSWRVDPDERWVVIGPNGAGKTTMLQVLAAQMHPTSGRAVLLGEELGAVDVFELRPRIGVTSAALADRIPKSESVGNVIVSASYAVMGRWNETYEAQDFQRAGVLMKQLRIDHLSKRTFGTLSEGERKRVQIARALMTDPELLLLDEPGAGLDLTGRESLVETLAELVADEDAAAVVLVTHHLEEIPPGMTHALLLRQGSIVAAGPIGEVLTDDLLSQTFGIPLVVSESDGRWTARAAGPATASGG